MAEVSTILSEARKRAGTGAITVLDYMLQHFDRSVIGGYLNDFYGVRTLGGDLTLVADYSRIDKEKSRIDRLVFLKDPSQQKVVAVGLSDPWSDDLSRRYSDRLNGSIDIYALTSVELNGFLDGPDVGENFAINGHSNSYPIIKGESESESINVIDFVDKAIRQAYDAGASDIHFETSRAGMLVKLRKDGVLSRLAHDGNFPSSDEVISRIKVISQLDITERRVPQDGRFRFQSGRASIDIRVSIMPSVFGEDAVLRLLDKAQLRGLSGDRQEVTLESLGFDLSSSGRIRRIAEMPHGLLLVTGPTGSGKTTTLYSILTESNSGAEKIITIEDPVEYELNGVLQIPVNERKGLTFAKGLRSILRHDPDKILVGEIRDGETAEIAVQSALTGHQVFTTVHANSVFDVTGRFRHFGIDMFGFMSSLNGVIVQRLIRCLCSHCKTKAAPSAFEAAWLSTRGVTPSEVSIPSGCVQCSFTGYSGRKVIAEVHEIEDVFRDLVISNQPVSALREHVNASSAGSLGSSAAHLISTQQTSFQEVRRVVGIR